MRLSDPHSFAVGMRRNEPAGALLKADTSHRANEYTFVATATGGGTAFLVAALQA